MPEHRDVVLYRPRPWQQACHKKLKRFSVLVLHRRAGKTRMAIAQLMHKALHAKHEKGQDVPFFAYVAPFLKQAKLLAWEFLKRSAKEIPGCVVNEVELTATMPHNQAVIRLFGADNPDAIRGNGFDGVVVDELKDIKPEVWYEILLPALADRGGWALFLGTPKGINLLSELYNYGKAHTDDWFTAVYTVYETDAIAAEEIATLRRMMSDNEFRREFLCDFSASGEDQLISIADIEDAVSKHYRIDQYSFAPKVLGVDVARFGDDRSVIAARQGLVCHQIVSLSGVDNMTLAGRLDAAINKWHPDAVFIDAGGGAGVVDRLRQLGHDVIEVHFGGKPTDDAFLNRRSEMWWAIREWIDAGGTMPNETELKQDLASPTYEYTPQGKRKLESKEDIKKRLLRSPDAGDALALTFAHSVVPKVEYAHPSFEPKRGALIHEYDPLEVS
jgi:hypothetical protein